MFRWWWSHSIECVETSSFLLTWRLKLDSSSYISIKGILSSIMQPLSTHTHTHTHTHTPHIHTQVIIDQDVLFECLMLTVNPKWICITKYFSPISCFFTFFTCADRHLFVKRHITVKTIICSASCVLQGYTACALKISQQEQNWISPHGRFIICKKSVYIQHIWISFAQCTI